MQDGWYWNQNPKESNFNIGDSKNRKISKPLDINSCMNNPSNDDLLTNVADHLSSGLDPIPEGSCSSEDSDHHMNSNEYKGNKDDGDDDCNVFEEEPFCDPYLRD